MANAALRNFRTRFARAEESHRRKQPARFGPVVAETPKGSCRSRTALVVCSRITACCVLLSDILREMAQGHA